MSSRRPRLIEELQESAPEGYFERRFAEIQAGETVWFRRNYTAGGGFCIDLYSKGDHLGYLVSEYDNPYRKAAGFTVVAYVMEEGVPVALEAEGATNPQPPELAAHSLYQYFLRRGQIQ